MPIDPNFRKNRKKVGTEADIAIWGPLESPETMGIRGTYVAVDWDICTGCGVCLETCPEQVYDWMETPNHPISEKKAFPARESDCVQCYKCEIECPVQAIRIIYPEPSGWLTWLGWLTFILIFLQLPGGIIYGILFGPSLGHQALFYAGWFILVLGFLFLYSSLVYFRRRGKPVEGRGVMATTELVMSGPYGLVRHPQFLGIGLMICASILISQHWLSALVGIPLILSMYKWAQTSEELLIGKFRDDYKRYMRRVPRMNLFLGIYRFAKRRKED